ncbi:MAG: peptidase S24 [Methanobrevibacter sp.]|uniref:S24/S26 family peptidase n=1 Tax=Methanobrevibacter sp. TaxID=66852 RepID=UPI0025EA7B4F|nr:S24/S26 family peptidase [Methanobrevibacter sp.]MBE6507964.1 peptidase S24 [Methanobrevibacter sp.]
MAKKIILALLILILIVGAFAFTFLGQNTVDVYLDGENVTVNTHTFSNIDTAGLNSEICNSTVRIMNDTTSDADTLKGEIKNICDRYGLENPKITVDSTIGPDQIPVIVNVDGTSMLPTLQDGQKVLINKSHDIRVGDIVVADSDEYGGIIKRVADINGNEVYLVSDNKNVSYEYINNVLYEVKGITTWVDVSDINGVVIQY